MKTLIMKLGKTVTLAATFALGFAVMTPMVSTPALAQDEAKGMTLDELLELVKSGRVTESRENKAREREFRSRRDDQARLLKEAEAEVKREEDRSDRLEKEFQDNELKLAELENLLSEKLGAFGELFGVVRQVAGDTEAHINQSLVSAQYGGRGGFLRALAARKELPKISELEQLRYAMQKEMTEQGKVVRFQGTVLTPEGEAGSAEVIRIGTFVAIADGEYLRYLPATGQLARLGRQPGARYLAAAEEVEDADQGTIVAAAVDPSRGAILSLLVQAPSITERVNQGGVIGYIIIALAIVGVLMALERIVTLSLTGMKVNAQSKSETPDDSNPLGRVMQAYQANKDVDVETLELKLDDAILKETPKLERALSTLKVMAAVAPMLGLLGTVTGMIVTFQAITLFGTGDPKLMAGGISQALITTVLGLVAAIPILLLHQLATTRSKSVVAVLEEQSAGIIARHAEDHARRPTGE